MSDPSELVSQQEGELVSEPVEQIPLRRWLLLDGDRLVLTGILSAGIFVICAALALAGFIPVTNPDPITSLTAGLVGGTLPFITIVLAVNQLVLSKELGWTNDLRERMKNMREFRTEVEQTTEIPLSPAAPSEFLRLLVQEVETLTQSLSNDCTDVSDQELQDDIAGLEELVESRSERVDAALKQARFGTFAAVSASLEYNTGQYLYIMRHVKTVHADSLPNAAHETLEDIMELLSSLDIARQYFKTIYTQHELAILSRLLLYAGLPALLGGGLIVLSYEAVVELQPGRYFLIILLSATVTVIFAPFTVLLSYTLRIATLATYTADFGPFVPQQEIPALIRDES